MFSDNVGFRVMIVFKSSIDTEIKRQTHIFESKITGKYQFGAFC